MRQRAGASRRLRRRRRGFSALAPRFVPAQLPSLRRRSRRWSPASRLALPVPCKPIGATGFLRFRSGGFRRGSAVSGSDAPFTFPRRAGARSVQPPPTAPPPARTGVCCSACRQRRVTANIVLSLGSCVSALALFRSPCTSHARPRPGATVPAKRRNSSGNEISCDGIARGLFLRMAPGAGWVAFA